MIDTGADSSLLHINAAKKYGCEVGPMDQEVWGIGGKAPAAVTNIVKLTMGEAVLTNRKVLATDMKRGDDDDNLDYVGLFGADFMRELDAVITYTENRIFLIQR
jgi:predicted aspartyl protease